MMDAVRSSVLALQTVVTIDITITISIALPVFKVRGFVRGSKNCARIELLKPVYHHEPRDHDDMVDDYNDDKCNNSVCGYFGGRPIKNFCHTGVCITVDLDCFCGISCLDPVTPED